VRAGQPVGALEFKTELAKVLPYEFQYHFSYAWRVLTIGGLLIAIVYFSIFIFKVPFGFRLIRDVFYQLVFGVLFLFFISNLYALWSLALSSDGHFDIWSTSYNSWFGVQGWYEILKIGFFVMAILLFFIALLMVLLLVGYLIRLLIKKVNPDFGKKNKNRS
jgi:hypothetical protein